MRGFHFLRALINLVGEQILVDKLVVAFSGIRPDQVYNDGVIRPLEP